MEKQTINFSKLTEPITPKWRIQSAKGNKAICVPYIDARDVYSRLDEVCNPENWQNTYDPDSGVAAIGIRINGEWIWKSDVGTESNIEKIKGKASDAIKRTAVLWGIGRDLYHLGTKELESYENKYAKTATGQIIYTGDQLTNYLNGVNEGTALLMQIVKRNTHLHELVEFQNNVKSLLEILKKEGR